MATRRKTADAAEVKENAEAAAVALRARRTARGGKRG